MNKYLFLALLFSAFGFSQNGISYQALILNPSGEQLPGQDNPHEPISNKLVCLKFEIIDHTNQIEYSETQKISTDAYGIVNLVIGIGEKIGGYADSFSDIIWGNNSKRLKVDLDVNANCSYFVEISNQPFTYIPLAYYAVNSGSSMPGPQGPAGATGPQGPAGATGPQGPAGINGTNGTNGTNGSSAYQLAVANGFVGTEAQWLSSLVGAQGPAGATGPQGPAGINGSSAYQLAVANGFVGTEAQWLSSIVGPQGPAGATGSQGPAGANGTNGSSAYQLAVANGFVGTEAQWLSSLVGAQGPAGATGTTTYNTIRGTVTTVTAAAYTLAANDYAIITNNATGVTITMPDLTVADAGRTVFIFNNNTAPVANSFGGTIPVGVTTLNQFRAMELMWTGSIWVIMGK